MRTKLVWTFLVISILGFTAPSLAASTKGQDTSRHLYDRVMEEFTHGDYEAALAGFRLFIEVHRQSALAANAQYWIGECQYRLGRYHDALNSFYNVRSYNPVSSKLAASAFKIGQTYSRLGGSSTNIRKAPKLTWPARRLTSCPLKIDPSLHRKSLQANLGFGA